MAANQYDVSCVECGIGMRWGEEHQLPTGGDHNAMCGDCYREWRDE